MRPRVFPAEDAASGAAAVATCFVSASMRPRVFPAEDGKIFRDRVADIGQSTLRFNEAAGIPRGRRCSRRDRRSSAGRSTRQCFNEAAGIPRGRDPYAGDAGSICELVRVSFNEAAGIPRGRPHGAIGCFTPRSRSTRFNEAAGIPRGRRAATCRARSPRSSSFNEAAGIPRGRPI